MSPLFGKKFHQSSRFRKPRSSCKFYPLWQSTPELLKYTRIEIRHQKTLQENMRTNTCSISRLPIVVKSITILSPAPSFLGILVEQTISKHISKPKSTHDIGMRESMYKKRTHKAKTSHYCSCHKPVMDPMKHHGEHSLQTWEGGNETLCGSA
jgi:hypothetical protein